jgi:hypothetical protein
MTTVIHAVMPLVLDRRAQAAIAVLAALATGLLLGPGEAAAHARGGG